MTAAASSGPEEAQYEEVPYVLVYATVSSTLLVRLLMAFQVCPLQGCPFLRLVMLAGDNCLVVTKVVDVDALS